MNTKIRLATFFIGHLITMIGCTKSEVTPTVNSLEGSWKLVQKRIQRGEVTTDIPLPTVPQLIVFTGLNQFRSTIENDTTLSNANYYQSGYSDLAGPYIEVRKMISDAYRPSYLINLNVLEGTLRLSGYNGQEQVNTSYIFKRQ